MYITSSKKFSQFLITALALALFSGTSSSFPLGIQNSKEVVCTNVTSNGGTCDWPIPFQGWSGAFSRVNPTGNNLLGAPSATLAEFTFGNQSFTAQFNWDWFDISIIPPGCNNIFSYQGCIDASGTYLNDGYDVGMQMKPLACLAKTRTCIDRNCSDAYGYPKDDSKTTVCQNISANWEVTFCPTGSCVDTPGEPTVNCFYDVVANYRGTPAPVFRPTPSPILASPVTSSAPTLAASLGPASRRL